MKAILLAGGKGTRISRFIQDVPKCTLSIDGTPLIRRTASIFLKKGIEVIVCLGYKQEIVKNALKDLKIKYYYNPFYAVTNSLGTLWFAKEEFNDDLIIMNADVFFDERILDQLIESNLDCAVAVDKSRCKTGDYFFATSKNGFIRKYGKDLPLEERTCEYVGIAKIKHSFQKLFIGKMNEMISQGKYNLWWENIMYTLADEGTNIKTLDFSKYFWSEIDFYDDYERILNYINKKS